MKKKDDDDEHDHETLKHPEIRKMMSMIMKPQLSPMKHKMMTMRMMRV
jgi:hypothetical protein